MRIPAYSGLHSGYLSILLLLFAAVGDAKSEDRTDLPDSILVRNVLLFDPQAGQEDVVVNIVIREGKLDLVTKDEVPADTVVMAVDAEGGTLLGKLALGESPSFLIFDEDPREDFDVLLDTATHARFAVHQGQIAKNTLRDAVEPTPGEPEQKTTGWLAYSPPPLALPTSYLDTSKWNRWESRYFDGIFAAGVVLDRQRWLSQDGASELQVGDLEDFDGGEIRGFRFGAVGTVNLEKPWVYTVFAATNAFDKGFDVETTDDVSFFDWRLDIPILSGSTLSIGKQKEPISMERIMSLAYNPMQERTSVSDALLPSRNVGMVLSGTAFDQRVSWAGGIFNDWLDSDGSIGDGSTQLVVRATWLPFVSTDESNLLHLGLGFRYSNAKEGLRGATEPEFNQSPLFVDTGVFEADGSLLYNLEASWRKGPFWLAGEYVLNDVDASAIGSPNLGGYHVTASWALTGEMRGYNRRTGILQRLPIARSVNQGGWGAWEAAARWSDLDLTDGLVEGGEMEIFSLGLNWWMTPFMNINWNYRWIALDRFGLNGDSRGFMGRITLLLE